MLLVDRMRTGSGSLPASKACGPTFRRNAIAKTRSASALNLYRARNLIERSSTRSSNVGVSQPDTTNARPTIERPSSLHQSAFGCVLMSPRPKKRCNFNGGQLGRRNPFLGTGFRLDGRGPSRLLKDWALACVRIGFGRCRIERLEAGLRPHDHSPASR
jgi:hypothetical protein